MRKYSYKSQLPILIGPLLSAIQPFSHHLTLIPLVIGLYWETSVRVSLGKLFHYRFCVQPTYGAQECQTCTDTALSGYQFTPWSSGASEIHFLCPEKFTLGQCRIRTTELSLCRRMRYHWTKRAPLYIIRSTRITQSFHCHQNNLEV